MKIRRTCIPISVSPRGFFICINLRQPLPFSVAILICPNEKMHLNRTTQALQSARFSVYIYRPQHKSNNIAAASHRAAIELPSGIVIIVWRWTINPEDSIQHNTYYFLLCCTGRHIAALGNEHPKITAT